MLLPYQLKQIAEALEAAAGDSATAATTEAGYWRRIAFASESLAGASTLANSTITGYMKRAAVALESIAGTSGAEENVSESGYLKRIVDALEVQAGAVTSGSLAGRFRVAALAATFGATSALSSVTIRDATMFDVSNVADAGNGIGIIGNGWVADIIISDASTADGVLDENKIVFTVQDYGYDSSGNQVIRTREIRGVATIRKQRLVTSGYVATYYVEQVGSDVHAKIALSDDIFDNAISVTVTTEEGFFGAHQAGAVASVTNNSTEAYPKPQFGFLNQHLERATGTFRVEGVATHPYSHLGDAPGEVACVKYRAKDAQATPNQTTEVTSSSPELSTIRVKGNPTEVYAANIDPATLTQADVCKVNAKVYPWFGDSTAVLDLEVDGYAFPTANCQTRLLFKNDKNGTYGGGIACVKLGAVGGTIQSSLAAAEATPFPTTQAAAAALPAWNTANKIGNTTHSGGTIYLMDDAGVAATHVLSGNMTPTSPAVGDGCWTTIKLHPNAAAGTKLQITATRTVAQMMRFDVPIEVTGNFSLSSGSNVAHRMISFVNQSLRYTAAPGNALPFQWGIIYIINWTHDASTGFYTSMCPQSGATVRQQVATMAFNDSLGSSSVGGKCFLAVGNRIRGGAGTEQDTSVASAPDPADGTIIFNNLFSASSVISLGALINIGTRGVGIVQNVFERAYVDGASPALQVGADNSTKTLRNYCVHSNTIVGQRFNLGYNDVPGAVGVIKQLRLSNNLIVGALASFNIKTDTFTTNGTETGRVGNHKLMYHAGNFGNVVSIGDANGSSGAHRSGSSWLGHVWPASGKLNVGHTAATALKPNAVTFADDRSLNGTSAGFGDYTPTHTADHDTYGGENAAFNVVPIGQARTKWDQNGTLRRNDGTGAAGAIERLAT